MLRKKFNKHKPFWIDDWYVDPDSGRLLKEESEATLESEEMKLLSRLVENAGNVVGFDELEASAWDGIEVGVNVVADTIIAIRVALDDDVKQPRYIETVPHHGYRLIAKVYHRAPTEADKSTDSGRQSDQHADQQSGKEEPFGGGPSLGGMIGSLFSRKNPLPRKLYTNFFDRGNAENGTGKQSVHAWYLLAVVIVIPVLFFIVVQEDAELPLPESLTSSKKAAATLTPAVKKDVVLKDLKRRPSVEIEQFFDLDANPDHRYFGNAIATELTRALAVYSALHVVSSDSLMLRQSGGGASPAKPTARYRIKGGYRLGGLLNFKVRMIDNTSGKTVWEESFKGKSGDVFAIQDKVRNKITESLSVSKTDEESERVWTHGTRNPEAYDYFLRARYSVKKRSTAEENRQAKKLISKAISIDPEFARAHAALAILHADAWRFGWTRNPDQSAARAAGSGEKAVSIDTYSPEAHWSLGYVNLFVQGDHARAIEMGERAIELDPNSPEGYTLLGVANVFGGNPKMASLLLEGVSNNNPEYRQQVSSIQALSHLLLGNHKASLAGFSEALSIDSAQIQSHVYKTIVLYRMGESDDAKLQVNQLLDLHPEFDAQVWARRQPFRDKRIIFGLMDDLDRVASL